MHIWRKMILLDLTTIMEGHKKHDTNELERLSFSKWDIKTYGKGTAYPFVVIDNWYLPHEEKLVWSEIDFLISNPLFGEMADDSSEEVAKYDGKKSKAMNKRIFYNKYFRDTRISHIVNCMYKQRSREFNEILYENCLPYYRNFQDSNVDSTFLSFYGDNDYYDTHCDTSFFTCLIWMVKEPRRFDGGDFELTDIDHMIELKNNRMVMIPGCFNHKVHQLKFHDRNDNSYGKYTISHFYLHIP